MVSMVDTTADEGTAVTNRIPAIVVYLMFGGGGSDFFTASSYHTENYAKVMGHGAPSQPRIGLLYNISFYVHENRRLALLSAL